MSFNTGNIFSIQIFGQSHSKEIGVVIDGLPSGIKPDMNYINLFLDRRKGGKGFYTTSRDEKDEPEIVSGLSDGKTCGAPLCVVFRNIDINNLDYSELKTHPRPSHSDYPAFVKYGGCNDIYGGGQFSGRMTLPFCFAGAVCMQILRNSGIDIGSHISSIGDINDIPIDLVNVDPEKLPKSDFPVLDESIGLEMKKKIKRALDDKDSVGGTIECAATGIPAGAGDPLFDGLDNMIAKYIFAIPAVKGLEFGNGFEATMLKGSENNDQFFMDNGKVSTITNNNGGLLAGMSNGMPLIFRVAFKPTASIPREQKTVDLEKRKDYLLEVHGRHDPCIVPRAVPVVEAAAAMAIYEVLRNDGKIL